jgi:anaerobic magnesium-protoporphyrin IX monomethyl ester cyclase
MEEEIFIFARYGIQPHMRILLFFPRGYDNTSSTASVGTLAASMAPFGIASIAAVLRKAGHDVRIIDATLSFTITNREWARRITTWKPDIVGFSVITSHFFDAYNVCQLVKEINPNVRTVFGGVHPSWGRERLLRDYPAIDLVIAGEGEFALRDLADGLQPDRVAGVFFRGGDGKITGIDRPQQQSLDDLPFPAYDLVEGFPRAYAPALFSYPRFPAASILSSRGCIYQCSYCDRSVFGKSFRWNSPEYTAELAGFLNRDFGVRHIMFYDDLFTLNRDRVARLCALMRGMKPRLTYNCIVRIGHIDDDLIAELKSSGCWMVHVGIESGDQAILDSFKEKMSLDDIRRDVEKLHAAGIYVKGLFMMGFPGETDLSITKTIRFSQSLPLKDANVTAFTPFPGSPVAGDVEKLGTLDNDWSKMDCVNVVFVPKEIESKQLLERRWREFVMGFYRRPAMNRMYRRMLWEAPHSYGRLLRHALSFMGYRRAMIRKQRTPKRAP